MQISIKSLKVMLNNFHLIRQSICCGQHSKPEPILQAQRMHHKNNVGSK